MDNSIIFDQHQGFGSRDSPTAAFQKLFPTDAKNCKPWVEHYASSYESFGSKERKRILVAVPHASGLADRLTSLASLFLVAVLTNRAFIIGNLPELQPLQIAFHTHHDMDPAPELYHLLNSYSRWDLLREPQDRFSDNSNRLHVIGNDTAVINAIGSASYMLSKEFIQACNSSIPNLFISGNRGITVSALRSKLYKKLMIQKGIFAHMRESIFGCALAYLLQPKQPIFSNLLEPLVLMSSSATKVVVHIRAGDDALIFGRDVNIYQYATFFHCAVQLLGDIVSSGQAKNGIILYFLSDSIDLRNQVQQEFDSPVPTALSELFREAGLNVASRSTELSSKEDKGVTRIRLVTSSNVTVEHTAKESVCSKMQCVSKEGFMTACAEWSLAGHADYLIFGVNSNFAKSAAMRSNKIDRSFLITSLQTPASCSIQDHLVLDDDLAELNNGI